MSPTLDAFLRTWPFEPWLLSGLALTAAIYLRGWLALHRQNSRRWHTGQPCAFLGGLAAVYLSLASPIEPFAALLLQVHMLQHMLLMMAAPPLCWLGEPMLPMLRGLPQPVRAYWAVPLLRSPALHAFFARLTHPAASLFLLVAATWLWHVPAAYELALRSSGWHYLQHACFFVAGLLFWYPVVRPYPSRPRWSLWLLLPYLILADVQNTILSALLTFSDHVLYPYYLQMPRLGRLSALEDQSAAGVIMWVPGSLAFLLPLFWIGFRALYGEEPNATRAGTASILDRSGSGQMAAKSKAAVLSLPLLPSLPTDNSHARSAVFDLLRAPLVGRFLKWRHARVVAQLPMAALAALLIFDGLRGPQVGAMNLAGVLPWIHWRGLLIFSFLAAGNFFCMACPFLLPRTLARHWPGAKYPWSRGRHWPNWLRSKWLSVALLVLFLWAYEAFSLWDSPWWTAWIAVGYFVAAFVIDGFFRDAAFCKYVCPIGQFNFVQSLVSPLEVKVRDAAVCATCRTKDCIRGRDGRSPLGKAAGCELHLFQPRKSGNMDCTFCLDCIHACPHENVGILARPLGSELWRGACGKGDSPHLCADHEYRDLASGPFRQMGTVPFSARRNRPDLAVLIVILVFGAFVNAAGMVAPVLAWQDRLGGFLRQPAPLLATSLFYLFGLLFLPLAAVVAASVLSRRWGRLTAHWSEVASQYSYALVPLGFSMWLSHYSFHFLTSYDTVVPTVQRFAVDLGWTALGPPHWVAGCCRRVADWLPRLEVVFLDMGLLLSLYTGYRIALAQSPPMSRAFWALVPWAVLITLLFTAGIWLVFQPMQMRGTVQM